MARAGEVVCGKDVNDNPSWAAYVFAVWNLIIRPPRMRYSQAESVAHMPMGLMKLKGQRLHRKEFTVVNARGMKLICTIIQPVLDKPLSEKACVVYCHGNSSNRLAGFHLVPLLCPLNIAVVCFDFAGSGCSEGDYVSLGYHEQEDLAAVIKHLRRKEAVTRAGVWGYSMGAAAALMHAAKDASLAGVVADSPFGDLRDLIQDICCYQLNLPSFLISSILPIVRLAIQKKAAFDINDVSPSKHVPNCFIPALFLHGDADDFVSPSHSSMLESLYSGESMRLLMPRITHASKRPSGFLERSAVFFVRALRWEDFLPQGVTEANLDRRARLHMVLPQAPQTRSKTSQQANAVNEVRRLVASKFPAERTLGFVRAACEVCGTYRGAKLLPSTAVSLADCSGGKWCPVNYSGNVLLGSDNAEVALCWSRQEEKDSSCASGNGENFQLVYFALLTPTAISLARVTLAPVTSLDTAVSWAQASPSLGPGRPSKPFGGLSCVSVEPLAFSSAKLPPLKPHTVSLRILGGGVEFSAGGATVGHAERWPRETAHIWCVHWRSGGTARQPGPQSSLQLVCSAELDAADAGSHAGLLPGPRLLATCNLLPFEERLAERLATLCLEGDELPSSEDLEDLPPFESEDDLIRDIDRLSVAAMRHSNSDKLLFPDLDRACFRSHMLPLGETLHL